MTSVRLWRPL